MLNEITKSGTKCTWLWNWQRIFVLGSIARAFVAARCYVGNLHAHRYRTDGGERRQFNEFATLLRLSRVYLKCISMMRLLFFARGNRRAVRVSINYHGNKQNTTPHVEHGSPLPADLRARQEAVVLPAPASCCRLVRGKSSTTQRKQGAT